MTEVMNESIRERIQLNQERSLSENAQNPSDTRGRERAETPDDMRTCFQLDRDRILYTAAFRRLKFKTQVFIEPVNDDTRTRLTHTLEVMQIARSVARALGLNEDLVEAIALAHDIGHTPFAHSGESVLDEINSSGFHHSSQSLRVVDRLANKGEGLNLTTEVRDGIVKHSKSQGSMFESVSGSEPITLEGAIVRLCDSVAYINHDIDDAIKAGYLKKNDLPDDPLKILGDHGGKRIDTSIRSMIVNSRESNSIRMSQEVQEANDTLRTFMFDNVYLELGETPIASEARRVIRELYVFLDDNPKEVYERLPFLETLETTDPIIDFISLQSDLSTIQLYKQLIDKKFEYLPDYY